MNTKQQNPWRRVSVTGDWMKAPVPAYSNGSTWNGFAVPYFTHDDVLQLIASGDFPDLSYDPDKQVVSYTTGYENDVEKINAVTIMVDGSPTLAYPIADGWCWLLAPDQNAQTTRLAIHELYSGLGINVAVGERDDDMPAFGFEDDDTGAFVHNPAEFAKALGQTPQERWGITHLHCDAIAWLNSVLESTTQSAVDAAQHALIGHLGVESQSPAPSFVDRRDIAKAIASYINAEAVMSANQQEGTVRDCCQQR